MSKRKQSKQQRKYLRQLLKQARKTGNPALWNRYLKAIGMGVKERSVTR